MDCPIDGSVLSLCEAIARELDDAVDCDHLKKFCDKYLKNKDYVNVTISRLLSDLHLGMLMVDNLQNLGGVKKRVAVETLCFLSHMSKSRDIPVVYMGTPVLQDLVQNDLSMALQLTGDGEIIMETLKNNSYWG